MVFKGWRAGLTIFRYMQPESGRDAGHTVLGRAKTMASSPLPVAQETECFFVWMLGPDERFFLLYFA